MELDVALKRNEVIELDRERLSGINGGMSPVPLKMSDAAWDNYVEGGAYSAGVILGIFAGLLL